MTTHAALVATSLVASTDVIEPCWALAGRFYRLLRDGDRDRHHHVHLSARGNEKRSGLENIKLMKELRHAVIEGPVHLVRPKLLTEGVAIIAIFPMDLQKHVGEEILTPTGWRVSWRAFDF